MKELFLFSGLGADKRVYEYLDLSAYKVNHVDWIDPLPNESIEQYAGRLSGKIGKNNPILMGVSFGGMVAIEIAKHIPVEKIILISSAKSREDIPAPRFDFMRKLQLHRFIPTRLVKNPNRIVFWFFGVEKQWEKDLLRAIMRDTNIAFFRWAIDRIVNWPNETVLDNAIHIHGTKDRLIPFTTADYKIEGGGHLMIINRAQEIDEIIKTCC
ncbi:MAG TPA: alpha/beta hydrolase [Chryseolinea sp.]